MPGGGTRTVLGPDHYEASLGQAQIQAVILPRDRFRARLTWAELHHLQVLRCEEDPTHSLCALRTWAGLYDVFGRFRTVAGVAWHRNAGG